MPKRPSRKVVTEHEPLLHTPMSRPPVIRVTPATKEAAPLAVVPADYSSIRPTTSNHHYSGHPISRDSNMKYEMIQHDSCSGSSSSSGLTAKEIYKLSCDGQINIDDHSWTDQLQRAILARDLDLCEALLCSGVPLSKSLLDAIPVEFEAIRELCAKFYPDMWSAVRTGNVKQVRCLVNLWHKVSLVRSGKPLFQLAIEHSNPYIISLIGGIATTMDVAHLVLAGDTAKLKAIRSNGAFIRRTLKHFGHNCAPILYFAMIQNDPQLVEELCSHFNLKSDDEMLDQDGNEIPLLFAALHDALDTRIIACFLRHTNQRLTTVWYHRKNILQYAIELQVSGEIFAVLVEHGGGQLLADRDLLNRSVVDLLVEREANEPLNAYRRALEEQIKMWISAGSREAIWLAVLGFEFPFVVDSFPELAVIQNRISSMDECIANDDVSWFQRLLQFDVSSENWPNLAWYGHSIGNGQTLLHRAVIRNRPEIVELILSQAEMSCVVLDNFGASALHYACAASDYCDVERLLLCAGFGEHYVDKCGHDSASYRMKRDKPEMLRFLDALVDDECTTAANLDPWLAIQSPLNSPNDDDLEDLPYRKRILTPPDPSGHSSRKSSTHSHGKSSTATHGALPDSWCSLS